MDFAAFLALPALMIAMAGATYSLAFILEDRTIDRSRTGVQPAAQAGR